MRSVVRLAVSRKANSELLSRNRRARHATQPINEMNEINMQAQDHFWSRVAASYEQQFVDPYRDDVRSPLKKILRRLGDPAKRVVADLGCGIGPLLPFLAEHFKMVYAVDFAEGMLERAREKVADRSNVRFYHTSFLDLPAFGEPIDVA